VDDLRVKHVRILASNSISCTRDCLPYYIFSVIDVVKVHAVNKLS